jgi:flagellar basal-body rod modification protein FlgD
MPIQSAALATQSAATSAAGSALSTSGGNQTTSQNFMKMLIAQLQNQDPTNPMDNAQMTSQLAQLSTVDGINQLNSTLSTLINNTQSSMVYQAANLIGREVVIASNQTSLSQGQAVLGMQLPSAADNVNVTIKNSAHQTVRQLSLGPQAAGATSANWDGKDNQGQALADGHYTFEVTATRAGQAIAANGTQLAKVSSVAQSSGNVMLTLDNQSVVNATSLLQIN